MKKIVKGCGILFGSILMVILVVAAIVAIGSASVGRGFLGAVSP
jgi:hypothetical protein